MEVEIGVAYMLCPVGFASGSNIAVTITGPESFEVDYVIPFSEAEGRFSPGRHIPFPGEPLGPYQVTAVQGDLVAHSQFVVVPATQQRVAARPTLGTGGMTFGVAVVRFEPNVIAEVFLYRLDEDWRFVAVLGVQTDEQGHGTISIVTKTGDDPATYGFSYIGEQDRQTNPQTAFAITAYQLSILPPLPTAPPVGPVNPN